MAYVEGGLWGCIVVMAAFFIKVVTFGTSMCIGVYNVEFLEYFQASATAVSLVGSINLGLLLGAGPLASIMMTRWSCRQIALTGAIISSIGVITMPFAPNLQFMYVFYGILSGLGYCLLYVPSHVLSGLYFYKQRSIATGIVTAGSGMGTFIFPVLFHYLIEYYGWRGSFYIIAGINLHTFVFAALLRPVPEDLKKQLKRKELNDKHDTVYSAIKRSDEEEFSEAIEIKQIENEDKCYETQHDVSVSLIKSNNDSASKMQIITNGETHLKNDGIQKTSKITKPCYDHLNEQDDISVRKKQTLSERLKYHFCSIFSFDFLFFCLSNMLWNAAFGILLVFLPKYMDSIGINREQASKAFTAVGAGVCFGSIAGGLLGNIKYVNRILLYIVGNFGVAVTAVLMMIEYFHTFAGMFVLSLINGFLFGIILGLLVVVTSDLLGTESLRDGYGYLMFSDGAGLFVGPPIAGILMDATSDLSTGLFVSGLIAALGGLSMCAVPIRRRYQACRK